MKRLRDFVPPGTDPGREVRRFCATALAVLALSALYYAYRYHYALSLLYTWSFGRRVLAPGARMPDFSKLTDGVLLWYWGALVFAISSAAAHRGTFYRESRSIYVMRRVPDRWEVHVRCLAVPVCAAAVTFLLCLLLLLAFWLVYRFVTPEACLGALDVEIGRAFL